MIGLDDNTAKHVGLVLRKKEGDQIQLTNGRGGAALATIVSATKKQVMVSLSACRQMPVAEGRKTAIAIAPVKNAGRFEWFLEKAAELGIQDIFLLQTQRMEKAHFRMDRLQQILVSAMLQSQQYWLPTLHVLGTIEEVLANHQYQHAFVAHCIEQEKMPLTKALQGCDEAIIFIGPEGDFTPGEVMACEAAGCRAVSLGNTRLRTETAAMAAVVMARLG